MSDYNITLEKLSRRVRSEFIEPLQVKFFESFERPGNDAVELQPGQPQIGADLVFILFSDVITKQCFPVSFNFQFTDHLAHNLSFFFAPELFKLIRLRITNLLSLTNLFLIRR